LPKPEAIRWVYLSKPTEIISLQTLGYGTPSKFLSSDGVNTVFNCQERLCAVDISKEKISLISTYQNAEGIDSAFIVLNKIRLLIAGIDNQLISLRQL
jgi:hypothetical protein